MNGTASTATGLVRALLVIAGLGLLAACQTTERIPCKDRGLDPNSREYKRCVNGEERRAMERELAPHYQARGP